MNSCLENPIPVVFIHFGNLPDYLINSIKQAVSFNNKVYLLTDNYIEINNIEIVNINRINSDEIHFKSYYIHMSTNTFQFEYMCIYRWYILKNFMNLFNLNRVLYLDSDVYLYSNTYDIILNYPAFDFAYNLPENQSNFYWSGSACCSIWTSESINRFCKLIENFYTSNTIKILQDKWNYHKVNSVLGGICDMTFLYFFSKENGFLNLGMVYNSKSFDFNNASSDNHFKNEYKFRQGSFFQIPTKDIVFINGLPYGYNLVSNKRICFFAITEYSKLLLLSRKKSFFEKIRYFAYIIKSKLSCYLK